MPTVAVNALILREPFAGVAYAIYRSMCAVAKYQHERDFVFFVPRSFNRVFPDTGNVTRKRSLFVGGKSASSRVIYEQLIMPFSFPRLNADYAHFPAWVAPKMFYLPFVVTIHDLIPFYYPAFCKKSTVRHFKSAVPHTVERADRIVVPTQYVRNTLLEKFDTVDEDVVSVVPFAPAHDPCPISRAAAKRLLAEKYGIKGDFLLYVGNIEPKKNLPLLLKAFFAARIRRSFPLKLVIVGRKAWKTGEFDRAVLGHDMEDMLIMPGYVPEGDVSCFYKAAKAFCFPSVVEGFGLPVIEALQEGCPCLLSDIPVLHETAGSAATYLPLTDLSAWREAIEKVADTKTTVQERDILQKQAARFSWKRTAQELGNVYSSLEEQIGLD
ncbi:MAG: glycosyltransferase family 1 protein [Planctomycetota bacterium]|nr:glycosyltransferase family 1 protein [Planctomycetota bacterium]